MIEEPEPANIATQLILMVILILINAFFSSAEMAIVSLNKNKIKELAGEGSKKAQLIIKLTEEPTKFLSTIQVGVTLAGFLNSALAATGISDDLAGYLHQFQIPYSGEVALVLITIVLSYITLIFGELVPKRIALQYSEPIALFSIRPIIFASKIATPFVKLLTLSTSALIKLVGLDKDDLEEKVSREEIRSLVEVGQESGAINAIESEMINSIFEFDNKLAYEVMTPRTDVYLINIETPVKEYIDELIEERYSRIPVYEGDTDNIIGILYMKDFIVEARKHGFENVNISSILHTPYFVPESKNIDDLFRELQDSKKHIAILIDEYGGFAGIVSIEDLIEEVMGDIEDEYDSDEPEIEKIDNNTYIIDGMVQLSKFNAYFNLNIGNEDYETIGGFIIDLLGRIPNTVEEDNIKYENLVFTIEEVREKRIERIKVHIEN